MPWRGASYEGEFPSLGWQLVEFWEEYLKVPAGPLAGKPMVLTDDQVQFFVRLYALTPGGRFVYRRAQRRRSKGAGKSPEGGMFVIGEFCGPVFFDGWDSEGEPVGVTRWYPWVQVTAVSEDQDENLYGPLKEMLSESALNADNGGPVDCGDTRMRFKDGRPGLIEPVTSAAGSREGQPITAAAQEETHLWFPSKKGPTLARTQRRNTDKTVGRCVEFTNAPALGEGSVAEATMTAGEKGEKGLLISAIEAPFVENIKDPENRREVIKALKVAYDDGAGKPVRWVDINRLYEGLMDSDSTEADGYRYFFNIARKSENRAFDITQFDSLAEKGGATRRWAEAGYGDIAEISASTIPDDTPVILLFDGARKRDSTVFTAWTVGGEDTKPKHHHVASWSRPWHADADYRHPRAEYRSAAREFVASHRVVLFAYDSSFHELDSLYEDWTDEFGDYDPKSPGGLMYAYPTATGKLMDGAIRQVTEDMREGRFAHDGNATVRSHVSNAVLAKNNGGWQMLVKEKDSLKIDGAVTFTFGYDLLDLGRQIAAEANKVSVYEERGLVEL